jgi:hypothetical protein
MSEEGKVSGDQWYPVVLLDDTDFKTGETGKVVGDLTVQYKKLGAGAGWTAYAPAAGDWQEHGNGEYGLNMGAGEFTSAGRWQVHIICAGALTYRFSVEVRSFTLEELFTGANLVTFKLKQLQIINNAGDALVARSTGSNGRGITAEGDGSGHGILSVGGAISGNGLGLFAGGGNGNGLNVAGTGSGCGIHSEGGGTGNGLKILGGVTSGAAIRAIGQAGNAEAMLLEGQGSADGLKAIGGVSGNGVTLQGGASIGHGVHATAPGSTGLSYAMLLERNGQTVGVGAALRAVVTGGASMAAVELLGKGSKAGLTIDGGTTGNGVEITGIATGLKITGGQGSSQGHGIHVIGGETVGSGDFHAVFLEAIGASCRGLKIKGAGTGAGMSSEGGLGGGTGIMAIGKVSAAGLYCTNDSEFGTGHGIWARAGEGGGNGIRAIAYAETAAGLHAEAEGANGDGIRGQSGIDGDGISGYAAGTGIGINAVSDQGDGIRASGSVISGNGHGFCTSGGGTGHGILAQSGTGATGDGARFEARSTNGNGVNCIKTGTGIDLKASDHSDGTWGHSVKKNTAIAKYKFVMLHETTGDPEPGLTVTAVKKLDAAAAWSAMSGSGTIVDNGSGVYSIDISQADSNGDTGVWKFTAPGAKATIISLIFES